MKFQGYGQIWDSEKNKVLIDFESGIDNPGTIEIQDQTTIDKLITLGYKPLLNGNEYNDQKIEKESFQDEIKVIKRPYNRRTK